MYVKSQHCWLNTKCCRLNEISNIWEYNRYSKIFLIDLFNGFLNYFYKLSKRKLNIFWRNIFLIVWNWNAMSWTSCVNKSWYAIMRGVALVTIYRCIRFQRRRMCQTWYIHLLTCHEISLVVLEYMCGLWVEYHYNVPKMSDQIIISYG